MDLCKRFLSQPLNETYPGHKTDIKQYAENGWRFVLCCNQEAVRIGGRGGAGATVFEWQINGLNFQTVNTTSF